MLYFRVLKNVRGETIAETLISTLIAALSMVMFASMVIASNNIVKESDSKVREYYENSSKLISKTVENNSIFVFLCIYLFLFFLWLDVDTLGNVSSNRELVYAAGR